MWLHHPGAQPPSQSAAPRTSAVAMPAVMPPAPRRTAAGSAAPPVTRTTRRRSPTRACDAVVVAVPPRFHLDLDAARAGRRQARAGREAGLPATRGLPDGAGRPRPRRPRGAGRRERSLQAAGRVAAPSARRRRDRRHGLRALHHASPGAQDGRRLAQRRGDGRRRRVLRGRDSLAAPGRQPRPGDHRRSTGSGRRRRAPARTRAPRA